MSLFDRLLGRKAPAEARFSMDGTSGMQALSDLPTPAPPKVKPNQQSLPSYLKTAKPSTGSALLRTDRGLANIDAAATYRIGSDSREVIRNFTRASPDLSAAVTAYVRTGITAGYTAVAYNLDGTCNPEGTSAVAQIIARMDVLNDYTIGFDDSLSLRSVSEVWSREIVTQGAMCGELVLDKARLPDKMQPIATQQIRLFPSNDAKKLIPKQFIGGEYHDLDVPTFFMVTLDADLLEPYPVSPIESAIQAVIFSNDFMNDIRRVVRRHIHPRTDVSIDAERFLKMLPQEVLNDDEKLRTHIDRVISDLQQQINGLSPEDAMVHFDMYGISVIDHGNTNLSEEYKAIQGLSDARMIAGAKVLPTILGKGGGTSNVASTEAMMYVKYVEGAVWSKLNEMFSKMFTLAARLLGHDVYVTFKYNAIDLRPENELESFKSMKQSRLLEQLSLGLITDDQASIELTGRLPPAGMKPLSGTGFFNQKVAPAGNGENGAASSNDGSTLNQNLNSSAPAGAKSKNQGKTAEVIPIASV